MTKPFLGVSSSLTQRLWSSRLADPHVAQAIAGRYDVPPLLGQILAGRGISPEEVRTFLNPTLKETFPDPSTLPGMGRAVECVRTALAEGKKFAVFGDYDVDGATSSSLLKRYFHSIGVPLRVYIPDRMTEGYGPNIQALRTLREEGVALVFTVDCGSNDVEVLAQACDLGLEVVVLDHHPQTVTLPPSVAVVNPKIKLGCADLAAVGVTFMFVVALNRVLRENGYFSNGREEPDLRQWLDLVALGTVCDMVPLVGINRTFVAQGLQVMARGGNIGLCALMEKARIRLPLETYHLGFLLGPRINAGGRVGESSLGARLLSTEDSHEAWEMVEVLDCLNRERQHLEAQALQEAVDQMEGQALPPIVSVASHGWHPGVVGIVASRLKERCGRPCVVIAFDSKGVGRGSGRSVEGVDLGKLVQEACREGILLSGGGHAMAAGLTVRKERLGCLKEFFAAQPMVSRESCLYFDALVSPSALTMELYDMLRQASPFGRGNPEPRVAVPSVCVAWSRPFGAGHVQCSLKGAGGDFVRGVAFHVAGTPLGEALLSQGCVLHVGGRLKKQGGKGVQLTIDDAALPE